MPSDRAGDREEAAGSDRHDIPRRSWRRARVPRAARRLHRPSLPCHPAGGDRRGAGGPGGWILRSHRVLARADLAAVRCGDHSRLAGEAPRRAISRFPRGGSGRPFQGAFGGSSRVRQRGDHPRDGRGGHRRHFAARRALDDGRDAASARRALPPSRREDGARHQLQSGQLAHVLADDDDEHGMPALRPDDRGGAGRLHAQRSQGAPRARLAWHSRGRQAGRLRRLGRRQAGRASLPDRRQSVPRSDQGRPPNLSRRADHISDLASMPSMVHLDYANLSDAYRLGPEDDDGSAGMSRQPGHRASTSRPTLLEVGCLAGLLLLGYSAIVGAYFLADDFLLIGTVARGGGGTDWSVVVHHLYSTQYVETFRPMVTFIHAVVYSAWGANPIAFHVLNLSIHLINAVLLYALVRQWRPGTTRLLSFTAAAAFAIHPALPEAVTYIGSLPGLSCAMFYLLALLWAGRYRILGRRRWLFASLASFVLALASKEEAVSLPFAIALLVFASPGPSTIRSRLGGLARLVPPYVVLLALYLAYRRLIFGRVTPAYYHEVHGSMLDILRGIATVVGRLISPINISQAGSWGWPTFTVVFAVVVVGLGTLLYLTRPALVSLAVCAAAFAIALIPINKILVLGVSGDLSNSRFLYFPALPFCAAIGLILWDGTPASGWRPVAVVALFLYIVIDVTQLRVNNMAWANAAELMRTMQQDSRRLTGHRANIEVPSIPDTIHGVLFDRGGFRLGLLSPFVSDNATDRRARAVNVPVVSREDVAIESQFPEPAALIAIAGAGPESAEPGVRITASFRPGEAKTYAGEVVVRHSACPDAPHRIAVRGHGTTAPPFTTFLRASLSPVQPSSTVATALTYRVTVTDVENGVAAEDVVIGLLPGSGWRLRYFT